MTRQLPSIAINIIVVVGNTLSRRIRNEEDAPFQVLVRDEDASHFEIGILISWFIYSLNDKTLSSQTTESCVYHYPPSSDERRQGFGCCGEESVSWFCCDECKSMERKGIFASSSTLLFRSSRLVGDYSLWPSFSTKTTESSLPKPRKTTHGAVSMSLKKLPQKIQIPQSSRKVVPDTRSLRQPPTHRSHPDEPLLAATTQIHRRRNAT